MKTSNSRPIQNWGREIERLRHFRSRMPLAAKEALRHFEPCESAYNIEKVADRREVAAEHEEKIMVALSTCDVVSSLKGPCKDQNRRSAIINDRKTACNSRMVHARQGMCI